MATLSPWYYTGFAFCQGHYWPHLIDELGLDKGGKGVGFNKVEIDSKRLIGGGVCMFVHVGPWCQLDAFYFHLFLEGDCFVNSFLLSHSLRKIRLKTVWRDLQIPPNWREKPPLYLFEKSFEPTNTNQTTLTGNIRPFLWFGWFQ